MLIGPFGSCPRALVWRWRALETVVGVSLGTCAGAVWRWSGVGRRWRLALVTPSGVGLALDGVGECRWRVVGEKTAGVGWVRHSATHLWEQWRPCGWEEEPRQLQPRSTTPIRLACTPKSGNSDSKSHIGRWTAIGNVVGGSSRSLLWKPRGPFWESFGLPSERGS